MVRKEIEMRLPAPIEKFAEQYFVPHANSIVWAAILVIFALFGYVCYRARSNKPIKWILLLAFLVWASVLVLLTIITFANEEEAFAFLNV